MKRFSLEQRRRTERGAALVEFAIVSIIFFTFVFGITEFGRMIFEYNIVSSATRDGARWAAVRGTASGHPASVSAIKDFVVGRSLNRLTVADVSVTYQGITNTNRPGESVVVTSTKNFSPLPTMLSPFASLPLSSTTRMMISR